MQEKFTHKKRALPVHHSDRIDATSVSKHRISLLQDVKDSEIKTEKISQMQEAFVKKVVELVT